MCPNATEAMGWYDTCFLRFSNRTIFGVLESWPHYCLCNTEGDLENQKFMDVVMELMNKLERRVFLITHCVNMRGQIWLVRATKPYTVSHSARLTCPTTIATVAKVGLFRRFPHVVIGREVQECKDPVATLDMNETYSFLGIDDEDKQLAPPPRQLAALQSGGM